MEIPTDALALCAKAARILAGQMIGDLWGVTRDKLVGFFFENSEGARQEARLDRDRKAVASAPDSQREELMERVASSWAVRLQDILDESPGAIEALAKVMKELQDQDRGHNEASDRVVVNQKAIGRSQNIYSGRDTIIGKR